MRTGKELTLEQLAKALVRLSPKEFESLVELLERENLKSRRKLVHREVAKHQVVSEKDLFEELFKE